MSTRAERLREEIAARERAEAREQAENHTRHEARVREEASREVPRLVKRALAEIDEAASRNQKTTRVVAYGEVACAAKDAVTKALVADGFCVSAKTDRTAPSINGDGYVARDGEPYCVWRVSW